ncbi:hypothetical protein KSP40_PGU012164 [Platanthera guangdongensis]|uniref:Uncharacterized protein n=1 Tax=Platanthera guangdongensis TaxID=2320717 RepID=A0ABR2MEW9_9ASPA
MEDENSNSYPTSAFSGKPVVVKTKIRTEGGKDIPVHGLFTVLIIKIFQCAVSTFKMNARPLLDVLEEDSKRILREDEALQPNFDDGARDDKGGAVISSGVHDDEWRGTHAEAVALSQSRMRASFGGLECCTTFSGTRQFSAVPRESLARSTTLHLRSVRAAHTHSGAWHFAVESVHRIHFGVFSHPEKSMYVNFLCLQFHARLSCFCDQASAPPTCLWVEASVPFEAIKMNRHVSASRVVMSARPRGKSEYPRNEPGGRGWSRKGELTIRVVAECRRSFALSLKEETTHQQLSNLDIETSTNYGRIFISSKVLKTGPDRPVRPVGVPTGHPGGPAGHGDQNLIQKMKGAASFEPIPHARKRLSCILSPSPPLCLQTSLFRAFSLYRSNPDLHREATMEKTSCNSSPKSSAGVSDNTRVAKTLREIIQDQHDEADAPMLHQERPPAPAKMSLMALMEDEDGCADEEEEDSDEEAAKESRLCPFAACG